MFSGWRAAGHRTRLAGGDRRPLRGYDAVHLAAALDLDRHLRHAGLPAVTFVAADAALCRAAAAEGLTVVDAAAVR